MRNLRWGSVFMGSILLLTVGNAFSDYGIGVQSGFYPYGAYLLTLGSENEDFAKVGASLYYGVNGFYEISERSPRFFFRVFQTFRSFSENSEYSKFELGGELHRIPFFFDLRGGIYKTDLPISRNEMTSSISTSGYYIGLSTGSLSLAGGLDFIFADVDTAPSWLETKDWGWRLQGYQPLINGIQLGYELGRRPGYKKDHYLELSLSLGLSLKRGHRFFLEGIEKRLEAGQSHESKGALDKAIAEYQKVIQAFRQREQKGSKMTDTDWEQFGTAQESLGDVYERQNKVDAAIAEYREAAQILQRGNSTEARGKAAKVRKKLGDIYIEQGKFDLAVAEYEQAMNGYPTVPAEPAIVLYLDTYELYQVLEEWDKAYRITLDPLLKALIDSILYLPYYGARYKALLANAYLKKGETALAAEAYKELIKFCDQQVDEQKKNLRFIRAPAEARKTASALIKNTYFLGVAHNGVGDIYEMLGKTEEAKKSWLAAIVWYQGYLDLTKEHNLGEGYVSRASRQISLLKSKTGTE